MKIAEMMDARRDVVKRLAQLDDMARPLREQLESIDRELFGRIRTLTAALEGETPPPQPSPPLAGIPWPKQAVTVASSAPVDAPLLAAELAEAAITLRDPAKKSERGSLLQHIIDVLRVREAPATRNEIYQLLTAKGVAIPGKDPKANLSAHLSYCDEIVRIGNGWALKQKEIAERQTPPDGGV